MTNSIDQQFIEYIVKSLVGKPDAVKVERRIDEKGVLLELTVDPEDLGRVIGKRGATAQSLRTLLRALGTKNDARYNLKIVDNGEPRPRREEPKAQQPAAADDSTVSDDTGADDTTAAPSEEPAGEPEDVGRATLDDTVDHDGDGRTNLAERTRRELAELDDLEV